MKYLYVVLLINCFFSCQEVNDNHEIISKKEFTQILKAIHLTEAKYEIQKNKNINAAKNILKIEYDSIFKMSNINATDFENSIKHYSTKTNELDEIYEDVIEELIKEKKKLP